MFEIKTRDVPARRLMSVQRRQYGDQTAAFVAEAKAAFNAHLDGVEPTGPFTLIFHGPVNHQADGPIEAALGVPPGIEPSDVIGIDPVGWTTSHGSGLRMGAPGVRVAAPTRCLGGQERLVPPFAPANV